MSDVFDKETRSWNMSRITCKNTKPEIYVRKFLFNKGFRYRLHYNKLPGKPDLVLPKYKTVIFVNGCFWHGHPACPKSRIPKSNCEYWEKKLHRNMERDQLNYNQLTIDGWRIVIIWECQISKKGLREEFMSNIAETIFKSINSI